MVKSGTVPWWSSLSLSRQFFLLCVILLLPGLGFLGQWTSLRVEAAVKDDIGARSNAYFRNFFAPYLPELERDGGLSNETVVTIRQAIAASATGFNLVSAKIWDLEGRILFDTDPRLMSARFPVTDGLAEGVTGRVAVEFDEAPRHHSNHPGQELLEVYVPLRLDAGAPVLAVAELYFDTTAMLAMLEWTRRLTWMVVGVVSAAVVAGIYLIVARGDSVIDCQKVALKEKVAELTRLLDHNQALRLRIQNASSLSAENSELHLRRIGADLHDGIGQLLTISLLKLEQLFPDDAARSRDYHVLRDMLDEAMAEVRAMVSGLTLPHILEKSLADAVALVVLKHRHRTLTEVDCTIAENLAQVGNSVKLAICRMVQEGLNNAFKHAAGAGQSVTLQGQGEFVVLTVSDTGPGLMSHPGNAKWQPLGLIGLRHRIISLGGDLSISGAPGKGVTLTGYFPRDA